MATLSTTRHRSPYIDGIVPIRNAGIPCRPFMSAMHFEDKVNAKSELFVGYAVEEPSQHRLISSCIIIDMARLIEQEHRG